MSALDALPSLAERQVFAEFDIVPADLEYLHSVRDTLTADIRDWITAQWQAEVEGLPWFEALHLAPDQLAQLTGTMSACLERLLTGERVAELYGEVERMTLVALRHGVRNTDIFQASTKLESILTGLILQLFPGSDQQTVALVTVTKFLKSLLYVAIETYRRESENELEARNQELATALEHQTATSEVLQVINSSPGDLVPVFDAILEKAHELCGAPCGSLQIYDGEQFRAVATRNLAEPLASLLRQGYRPDASALRRQMLSPDRGVIQFADFAEFGRSAAEDAVVQAVVDVGLRTLLMIPLRKDRQFLGRIVAAREEVRPFTDKQIALLENFAAQAVIAMENARLLGELRQRTGDLEESLKYQTATSDVLKVISRSTFDLQPVLDTLVHTAGQLCQADLGHLALPSGDAYRSAAGFALSPELDAQVKGISFTRDRGSVVGRAAVERRVVHVADIHADPEHRLATHPAAQKFRTMLGVPLLREGEPIGVIAFGRQRVEPFTERQIELIRTFADQAVIAIENARLLGELQRRTDELTRSVAELQALEEVLRAVNSSLDLDTVLATIISRAVELSHADEGTIYQFDESEEVFVPKSAFGMSAERVAALHERKIRLGETHLGRAAAARAPVHVEDVQQDPAFSVAGAGGFLEGIHAVLAVPLLREDKVVGGLVIRRRRVGGFAPTIPTLLQTFAGQAVLAIENAGLFQEAGRARAAAEAALAELHRAQDRLIQSEKMASLGQLTAGIAHEIKNPLNFVNNFATLSVELLDELKDAAAAAIAALDAETRSNIDETIAMLTGNLDKIAEHGKRADGIVKSMLEHSRGESGERRVVDLNALVEEALNLAYHGARAQDQNFNVTMERALDPAAAPIELVPQDVTRVLLNLFGNGFYAACKRGREAGDGFRPMLRVTTRDLGETVEVRVRDNGAGISPEIRDKLFQPFFTTKPTGEGTGLGLSISYDIIAQQHGGTIEVDSEVGAFSEFIVRLPRGRQNATAES